MKAKVGSLKRSMGKKKKKAQETLALQWLRLGSSMAQGPSLAGGMHSMPKRERERERERRYKSATSGIKEGAHLQSLQTLKDTRRYYKQLVSVNCPIAFLKDTIKLT